jgi:4-amino-4-deoxy-L-arabinose transferase-like glycosyltransferase
MLSVAAVRYVNRKPSRFEMNETTNIAGRASTALLELPRDDAEPHAAQSNLHSGGYLDALSKPILALPSLTIFFAILYFLNLGSYPLYTKGEPREAVTIFNIVSGGGVILPMRAGIEIPSKPPLMHWIAAIISVVSRGVNEWTVRFPSALFAIAGVLVCYYYVRRLFNERAALVAALILGTTGQYLQAATAVRVDMTLTFFMEVAFFEFLLIGEGLTRRRTLLYVAIALAILTKGPVGLVIPGAVALIWIAMQWRWSLLRDLNLARGAIIVAILAGWWYVAASIIGGRAFIEKQLILENLVRFFGAAKFHEGHRHPFYYLEGALAVGFMPWTPVVAIMLWRALRSPLKADSRLNYLLIWFATVLILYSFAHSKRGSYLLSLYPALATMMALYIVDAIDRPQSSVRIIAFLSSMYGAALAIAGGVAILALAMLWAWPSGIAVVFELFKVSYRGFTDALRTAASRQWALSVFVPVAIFSLGVYLLRSAKSAHRMALGVGAGMGLLAIAANAVVVPAIANSLSLKGFTIGAMKNVDDHPLGYLLDMDYDVVFYSRRNFPIVMFKDANKPQYLICWENIWQGAPAELRGEYQSVMTSNPTDLDGGGRMLLLKKVSAPKAPAQPTPSTPIPPSSDDDV